MNKTYYLAYLLGCLSLQISCAQAPSSPTGTSSSSPNTSTLDTLRFRSGIRAIFQDSKDNYWLGSQQEGLARYDGKRLAYFGQMEGLTDLQIRSIQEDDKGHIWLGTANGVYSYDGRQMTRHQAPDSGYHPAQWTPTGHELWFAAGPRTGVYHYDGQTLQYLAFPPASAPADNSYTVSCIAKGKNDSIWIGTYAGIFGYGGQQLRVINDASLGLDKALHVRSLLEDSRGRLWIGNNGIGVLLMQGEQTINFSEQQHLIHPGSKGNGDLSPPGTLEHVFAIAEDAEGNIWFGDRDTGAWKYDGQSMSHYTVDSSRSSQFIGCIYKDREGRLLFAMEAGGVYQWNGQNFERRF